MADDRTLRVRIQAEIGSYVAGLKAAGTATQEFGRNLAGMGASSKADMEKIGKGALLMAGGIGLALGGAAKAAIDWESAWAGVTKTVDGTTGQMADLEAGLRDLAKELPATHAEIAAVAESAGALGIQRSAIEGFTKTMIDLGETTDLTADQAATAMAQIANVMGTSQDEFDRMGSALVDLGNKGASTESEILQLASRLAAAGEIAGLSEAEVFGFASTLASVGVEAEAGGTAVSKVFTRVRDAVIDGGAHLETFGRVAGVTAEQFATAFRRSPTEAIELFIAGLDRMNKAGQSTSSVFVDLDLNDERLKRALLSVAGAGELLSQQLDIGRQAWEDNNALQTEAEKRYATTAAQMEMLRNQVVDFGIDLGNVLIPAIRSAMEFVGGLVKGFSAMPDGLKFASVGLGILALGLTGMVGVIGVIIPKIVAMRAALISMGAAGQLVNTMLPWLAAAAVAIGVVAHVMGQNARAAEEAEARVKGYAEAIRDAGDKTEGTTDQIRSLLEDAPDLADLLSDAGISADELGTAISGSDEAWQAMRTQLIGAAEDAGITGIRMDALTAGLDAQRTAAIEGAAQASTLNHVIGDTGTEADNAAGGVDNLNTSLGMSAEEAEAARGAFEDLLDAYRGATDPLFAVLDALESNRDAVNAEAEQRAEGLEKIAAASKDVAAAESDLAAARAREDNADGIAAAEERLADARERLDEVNADAAITEEEHNALVQAAAESARDLMIASAELAAGIRDGSVSLDESRAMLEEWTSKGLITEEQARTMAEQFGVAAGKADELAQDWVASVYLQGMDKVNAALDGALAKLGRLIELGQGASAEAQQAEKFIVRGIAAGGARTQHTGGVVHLASGGFPGSPMGVDTVAAWLQPGEFVLRKSAVDKLGVGALDRLNAGQMFHGGSDQNRWGSYSSASGAGSYSVDNSRHMPVELKVIGDASRSQVGDAVYELRKLQIAMA